MANAEYLELALSKKMKTEIVIKGEPEIDSHMSQFWTAFWELNEFRPFSGQGISPIPKQDIENYANEHFYENEDDRLELVHVIKAMDHEYRKTHHEQIERKIAQERAKASSGRRRR